LASGISIALNATQKGQGPLRDKLLDVGAGEISQRVSPPLPPGQRRFVVPHNASGYHHPVSGNDCWRMIANCHWLWRLDWLRHILGHKVLHQPHQVCAVNLHFVQTI
jgi:hypothetical protein